MHITELRASNLKGRSFTHTLTPATLVVGPNFSGKTAILDAIRFALLGHLPEVGKKASATFELASGSDMTVTMLFSDNRAMDRSLHRERSAVKSNFLSSGIEDGALACPLLDASEYWSLTDNARIDYIFARVTLPEEYTAAGIMAKLHRLSFGEKHTEELETAKAAVLAQCQAVLTEVANLPEALTKVTGDTLKKEFTEWNGAATRSQGAVVLLTELKNREGECSAETLQDLREEAATVRARLEEANRTLGTLQAQADAAAASESRRVELLANLAKEEPKWEEPVFDKSTLAVAKDTAGLVEELATVEAKLTALPSYDKGIAKCHELSSAIKRLRTQEARAAKDAVEAMEMRFVKLDAQTCCPWCKAQESGWRDRVKAEMQAESEKLFATLKQAVADERAAIEQEKRDCEASIAADETDAQRADLVIRRDELKQAIVDIEQANILGAAVAKRAADKAAFAQSCWREARHRDRKEMAVMQSVPAPTAEELVDATARAAADRIVLTIASDKIATAERLQNDLLRASQAAEEHRRAAARRDVIKSVGKLLQEQKGEMVAAAFKELLTIANGIAGDILTSPLAYHDGEIGMFSSTEFITHRTMSGSEQAIAFVAIAAALSSKAPFRLLILDELARFTPSLQHKVLMSFQAAVERGDLDQVIAVLPMDECQTCNGKGLVGRAPDEGKECPECHGHGFCLPEIPGWTVIATGKESK